MVIAPFDSVLLEGYGVRLEPLSTEHRAGLVRAANDGRLWELGHARVPRPTEIDDYVASAIRGQREGHTMAWAVRELAAASIVGATRYYEIEPSLGRLEIGHTWYGARWQRTHVNKACKLLLFSYAFETLGCQVVALHTDVFNVASQRAIEALGAKKDGVMRHLQGRSDGSRHDVIFYSVLASEWPSIKRHLQLRLGLHAIPSRYRGAQAVHANGTALAALAGSVPP